MVSGVRGCEKGAVVAPGERPAWQANMGRYCPDAGTGPGNSRMATVRFRFAPPIMGLGSGGFKARLVHQNLVWAT